MNQHLKDKYPSFIKAIQRSLFRMNALPDPDFRYFSNANALYLSLKAE